jgi:hypothetical protein
MATLVRDNPYHDRRSAERRRIAYPAAVRAEGMRVSWGGVFGGVLVALGFLLLMTALGVAVGISAAQPGETDAGTLGTGAGIWGGLSLLIALFLADGFQRASAPSSTAPPASSRARWSGW